MPYGRRNFAAYQRSGSPATALPSTKSLASYRNKISAILLVTSVYTAFLYQRGQSFEDIFLLDYFVHFRYE